MLLKVGLYEGERSKVGLLWLRVSVRTLDFVMN